MLVLLGPGDVSLLSFPWVFYLKFGFHLFLVMVMFVDEDILNFLLPPKY